MAGSWMRTLNRARSMPSQRNDRTTETPRKVSEPSVCCGLFTVYLGETAAGRYSGGRFRFRHNTR
jgi:hypothetical protein